MTRAATSIAAYRRALTETVTVRRYTGTGEDRPYFGTGVNQPRGFTTYNTGTNGTSQIEQVISGAATAITADGLINLQINLKELYTPNASWLMRRTTVGNILRLKDGDGQYVWRPSLEVSKPAMLLGSPVFYAGDMAAVGAGSLSIAFGDFRRGYTVVDRLGISTLRDQYTDKPFVVFYTRRHVGGDVTDFDAIKLMVTSA